MCGRQRGEEVGAASSPRRPVFAGPSAEPESHQLTELPHQPTREGRLLSARLWMVKWRHRAFKSPGQTRTAGKQQRWGFKPKPGRILNVTRLPDGAPIFRSASEPCTLRSGSSACTSLLLCHACCRSQIRGPAGPAEGTKAG